MGIVAWTYSNHARSDTVPESRGQVVPRSGDSSTDPALKRGRESSPAITLSAESSPRPTPSGGGPSMTVARSERKRNTTSIEHPHPTLWLLGDWSELTNGSGGSPCGVATHEYTLKVLDTNEQLEGLLTYRFATSYDRCTEPRPNMTNCRYDFNIRLMDDVGATEFSYTGFFDRKQSTCDLDEPSLRTVAGRVKKISDVQASMEGNGYFHGVTLSRIGW